MSLEKSDKKNSQRRQSERQPFKNKGSYTQQGFYRKNYPSADPHLSNQSQKDSKYQANPYQKQYQPSSELNYTTLNPSKYGAGVTDLIQEQQYEVLAVFELNRERQKNRILEKRLINKEVHITKMKEVHNQLTQAFEKCQAQLQFYKRKSSQSVDVRQYVQEINELKHLVIRLQDKITEYQKQESKRYNSVRNQQKNQQTSPDAKNTPDRKGVETTGRARRDKRSKTVAHQQDSSPEFKKLNIIEEYVVKYPNRITNFISQFMAMVECFSAQAQKAKEGAGKNNIKRRMKIGWKWIKEVVIEWNHSKNYIQRANHFHDKLKKVFNIPDSKQDEEVMDAILAALSK